MKRVVISVISIIIMTFTVFVQSNASARTYISETTDQAYEVVDLREKNADTYRLPDGSYECVVYAEDKYYEDETGNLSLINNSIVPEKNTLFEKEYSYTNEANSSRVYFSENEAMILVSFGNDSLGFNAVNTKPVHALVGGLKDIEIDGRYSMHGDNFIAYKDAYENCDLVYEVRNDMVKEFIVLNNPSSCTDYSFSFDVCDYTPAYTENKTVAFYNAYGETVFELGKLSAIDSAGAYTEALNYSIGFSEGSYCITISLSDEYAYDPERVYPILIDPPVSIMITGVSKTKDTFVSSNHASSNYSQETDLYMGWNSTYNVSRTYIKYTLPPAIIASSITEAYISIKKHSSGSSPSIKAYRVTANWDPSTINWNNKPGYSTTYASDTAQLTNNNWYRLYVTDIVKKWKNGTYTNYGFLLKNASESGSSNWASFYSSEASSPKKPELRITYTTTEYYCNVYPGLNEQDTLIETVRNDIDAAFYNNGYGGHMHILQPNPNNNLNVATFKEHLKTARLVSCITHGNVDRIKLSTGNIFYISDLSSLSSSDLNKLKFVYLGACLTGYGEEDEPNIVNAFYEKGVDMVIGFSTSVVVVECDYWSKHFMIKIAEGNTVNDSINHAKNQTHLDTNIPTAQLSTNNTYTCGSIYYVPCPHD